VFRISAGEGTRVREFRSFLVRTGPRPGELKGSMTFEMERKQDKIKANDPYGNSERER
jgi:hypothetical protein